MLNFAYRSLFFNWSDWNLTLWVSNFFVWVGSIWRTRTHVDYADQTAEESSAGLHVHIKSRTSTLVQSDRRTTENFQILQFPSFRNLQLLINFVCFRSWWSFIFDTTSKTDRNGPIQPFYSSMVNLSIILHCRAINSN